MSKSLKSIFAAVLAVLMVLGMASCAKTPASSTGADTVRLGRVLGRFGCAEKCVRGKRCAAADKR